MDMSLDYKKARTFDCSACNVGLAKLRNCDGTHPPAKNVVNSNLYSQCPKNLWIQNRESRMMVELYMDCRESKILPFPGSLAQQTQFTKELFIFLDNIVAEWKSKQQKKEDDKMKRAQDKLGVKGGK